MRGRVGRCLNQCFDTTCNIVNLADRQGYMTGEIHVESLKPLVRGIDDDDAMRRSWAFLIEGEGWDVAVYSDALDFISSGDFQRPGCLVLDVRMPRMSGLELQDKMRELGIDLPIIFISGHGDIDMAVRTLKLGAVDFLQKPVDDQRLLTAIGSAVMNNLNHRRTEMELSSFRSRLMQLTQREREVIRMVAHGMSNKQVAENLGISEKTVQVHRGSAYRKLDLHNAAEIALRKTSGSVSVRRFCFVVGLFRRSSDRATARTTDAEAGEPHPKAILRASFLLFPWIFSSHGFGKLFLHVRRDGAIQKILHRVKLFVFQVNTFPIKLLIKKCFESHHDQLRP